MPHRSGRRAAGPGNLQLPASQSIGESPTGSSCRQAVERLDDQQHDERQNKRANDDQSSDLRIRHEPTRLFRPAKGQAKLGPSAGPRKISIAVCGRPDQRSITLRSRPDRTGLGLRFPLGLRLRLALIVCGRAGMARAKGRGGRSSKTGRLGRFLMRGANVQQEPLTSRTLRWAGMRAATSGSSARQR